MIVPRIAFRNIARQKRRSILTGLTMAGGFVLLSFAMSISEGTYSNVIKLFTLSYTGHVQLHKDNYLEEPSLHKTINNLDDIRAKLKDIPGLVSWAPRVFSPALSFNEKKTTVAKIIGIDPAMEKNTTKIIDKIERGNFLPENSSKDVVIGGSLAQNLGLKVGSEMVLIAQGADGSIANDLFRVTGIMRGVSGSTESLNCYMHIKTAQEFLTMPGRYHEIAVTMQDYSQSRVGAKMIRDAIKDPSIEVEPWENIQKNFYRAMMTDKKGMWIGLSIIMIIVAIGVLNTVLMTILERTREFGVLRALGTRSGAIFFLIVCETVFLSIASVLLAIFMSLGINHFFSIHGIDYPQAVEMGGFVITTMYGSIIPKVFVYPALVTLFTAILVSLPPAVRAMRITPMKAIRTV